ncbi:MAG: cell division protein FtsZ [Candidatus Paceibacterota bacterium]
MPRKKTTKKKKTTKRTKSSSSKSFEGITKIKVIGVGGGGGNIISRMKDKTKIKGVEYIAVNTDAQDLNHASANKKIHIGKALTKGLGAGMNPEIGKRAAEENRSEIGEILEGADVVFVVAGFGGGTGSGAAPVIAEIAKEKDILTIGVTTKPFSFEGSKRMSIAQDSLGKMKDVVDSLVVIPNDRVFSVISKDTPVIKAFEHIDDVLIYGVQALAELVNMPGIINVDFADIAAILKDAGPSLIGVGIASGQDRGVKAVNEAINSPLIETSIEGAKGVLFSISGTKDLKMSEINDIAKAVVSNLDSNAKVIFGAYHDRTVKKKNVKVTVIATGFSGFLSNGNSSSGIPQLFSSDDNSSSKFNSKSEDYSKKDKEDSSSNKEKEKKPEESKTEPWDIPAFLRKKKK